MECRHSPLVKGERFTHFEAWIDLHLLASHKDHTVGDVDVRRGQVLTSQEQLAKRWKWDRKTVRSFLRRCHERDEVVFKPKPTLTLITICDYEGYEGDSPPKSQVIPHQFPTIKNGEEWKRSGGSDGENSNGRHSGPPVGESWKTQQRLRKQSESP